MKVKTFYCDTKNQLSISMLGKALLNAAEEAAEETQLAQIQSDNIWVIVRLNIELNKIPKVGDEYTITTWISKNQRGIFTDRCFEILDKNGQLYGSAKSVWSMINYKTRESINFGKQYPHFDNLIINKNVNLSPLPRTRPTELQEIANHKITYSNLDKNCHLNSISYIDYALDTFDLDFHSKHNVHKMEISYQHECKFGDKLTIKRQQISEHDYLFIIYNKTLSACRIQIHFTPFV